MATGLRASAIALSQRQDPGFIGGLLNEAVRSGGELAGNLGKAVGVDIQQPEVPAPYSDPNAPLSENLTSPTFYGETIGGMLPRAAAPIAATIIGTPLAGAAVAGAQTAAEEYGKGSSLPRIAATGLRDAALQFVGAKIGGARIPERPLATAIGQVAGQEALANAGNIGTNVAEGRPALENTLQTSVGTALVTAPAEALAMRGQRTVSPAEAVGQRMAVETAPSVTVDAPTALAQQAKKINKIGFKAKVPVLDVGYEDLARPARVFEALDGDKPGPWTEGVWRPVSDASYAARERNIATQNYLKDGLNEVAATNGKKLGGVLDEMHRETAVGDGPKLRGSERIGIAMLAKNDLGKITRGGLLRSDGTEMASLTEQQVRDIADSLTPVERGVAGVLAKRWAEQGPQVDAVHQSLGNEPLQLQTDYFPNHGPKADAISAADIGSAPKLFNDSGNAPSERTAKGFTKEKSEEGWQRVRIDALDVFNRNTAQVDYYLEMAPTLKRVADTVSKPEVLRELRRLSRNGSNLKGWMQQWIEDSGRPFVGSVEGKGEAAMRSLRTKGTQAVLAGRIPTMLKQPVSLLNAAGEAGYLAPIAKGVVKTLAAQRGLSRNRISREMGELFPEVRTRTISRELEDLERTLQSGGRVSRGIKKTTDALLQGLRLGDKLAVTAVSKGVFDHEFAANKKAGMSDAMAKAAAVERTKQVLERTQNDARTVALPQLFRQPGELTKFLTVFGNEMNQALNTNYANVRKLGKQPTAKTAKWLAYGVVAPAISYAMINRALNPAGAAENLPAELTAQLVGGIPVVGNVSQAFVQYLATGDPTQLQYAVETTPIGLGAYGRIGKGVTRGMTSKEGFDTKAMTDIAAGAASAVGLPGEQIRVSAQAVQDADPLGIAFSRYQRREAGSKGR